MAPFLGVAKNTFPKADPLAATAAVVVPYICAHPLTPSLSSALSINGSSQHKTVSPEAPTDVKERLEKTSSSTYLLAHLSKTQKPEKFSLTSTHPAKKSSSAMVEKAALETTFLKRLHVKLPTFAHLASQDKSVRSSSSSSSSPKWALSAIPTLANQPSSHRSPTSAQKPPLIPSQHSTPT